MKNKTIRRDLSFFKSIYFEHKHHFHFSKIVLAMLFIFTTISCTHSQNSENKVEAQQSAVNVFGETAYFASGCFWCVEAVYESVEGVKEAVSGYSGGETTNPTYKQVSSGYSDHAEAVKVIYDPAKINFKTLLTVFFDSHNPTTLNQQGPDRGTQYRSIAFYQNEKEKMLIEQFIDSLNTNKVYQSPVVTEVQAFTKFWRAEEYHQNYEKKHPNDPYIRNVSIPRLERFQAKHPNLLKDD